MCEHVYVSMSLSVCLLYVCVCDYVHICGFCMCVCECVMVYAHLLLSLLSMSDFEVCLCVFCMPVCVCDSVYIFGFYVQGRDLCLCELRKSLTLSPIGARITPGPVHTRVPLASLTQSPRDRTLNL